ncbi:hypothetical protein F1880_007516 [Penicillium rolfsii]|nr:hypothetical protein F1880_007516 [Penicillium rolfsii]
MLDKEEALCKCHSISNHNYYERICAPADDFLDGSFTEPAPDSLYTIPQHAFLGHPFTFGKAFPVQTATAVVPSVLQPVDWDRMHALMDSCIKLATSLLWNGLGGKR